MWLSTSKRIAPQRQNPSSSIGIAGPRDSSSSSCQRPASRSACDGNASAAPAIMPTWTMSDQRPVFRPRPGRDPADVRRQGHLPQRRDRRDRDPRRADAEGRCAKAPPDFVAAGCKQWTYTGSRHGKLVSMPYWSVPDGALDDPGEMAPWARRRPTRPALRAGK